MPKFHLTRAGLEKFSQELAELKSRRPEIAEAIASAREQGDLSENAGYQSAKEEQDLLESRIEEVENIIKNVIIIDDLHRRSSTTVDLGSTVHLKSTQGVDELVFNIVGTMEADPMAHKISDESPVGQRLIGQTLGAEILLSRPEGEVAYKITAIK